MPSWTDSSDRQLLLSIIHAAAVPTPKWDAIAVMMGDGYTAEAVRQRFQKLKRLSKDDFGDVGEVAKGSAPKRKGRKKGGDSEGAATLKKGASGKRKGKATEAEEDDEEEASPEKKVKVEGETAEEGVEDEF